MVLLWHTVPVNSLEDLRTRETNMGASGANSTPAFYTRLLNATLGTKMRLITAIPARTMPSSPWSAASSMAIRACSTRR